MKRFMVISMNDKEHGAAFFDSYEEAKQHSMDVNCGMGGLSQIYEWNRTFDFYEFVEE